ncbi:hypothetical protein UA08_03735 [Talaromyces atroroseus]|uniref:Methyltransferase type 11 domain-containing protein n=1 Tax=Talaromyces atroroseus TaxID=1441469 RepID=A0A225B0T5_TALAT|nr:hypothetical protein UA08_03735 [Talaromyces atroroseus]OKL60876.1 hypothetical protein UA08_03735 [Talaromyces atroroseus]
MSQQFQREKTFSAYSQNQGNAYAQIRRDYHPNVYQTIIDHHTSTGGRLDTLLDVGCGPGLAARALAKHFTHVTGLDPSEGMLATARSLGGTSASSEPIRYEVSTAEELGQDLSRSSIEESSVDLITAANAAHWFDMSRFWLRAAKVLRPGGSVALWNSGEMRAHPSLPNADAIQAAIDEYQDRQLKPYREVGNIMARNRYTDLLLPWNMSHPMSDFDEAAFFRKDWNPEEDFFVGLPEADLGTFEKLLATHSAYTRWAQAHPDIAGTDKDQLKILRKEIERLLRKAGVKEGSEKMKCTVHGTILIVKKI